MSEPLLIAGMAVVTFAARYPLLALVGRLELPEPVVRALRFVPTAVLVAITVPAALMPQGALDISIHNAYLVGALVAVAVAWRSHNLLLTMGAGMTVFVLWRAFVGA